MGRAAHFVIRLHAWLDGLEWLWRLAVRLPVGIEFFGSGLGKLPRFIQYFRTLGVPSRAAGAFRGERRARLRHADRRRLGHAPGYSTVV
jgi:hypothetical protein